MRRKKTEGITSFVGGGTRANSPLLQDHTKHFPCQPIRSKTTSNFDVSVPMRGILTSTRRGNTTSQGKIRRYSLTLFVSNFVVFIPRNLWIRLIP